MQILVTIGHQYGQQVVHPACEHARTFCELAATRTLTPRTIELVKRLGYKVVVVPTEPKEL
jgi:hypothetical protein